MFQQTWPRHANFKAVLPKTFLSSVACWHSLPFVLLVMLYAWSRRAVAGRVAQGPSPNRAEDGHGCFEATSTEGKSVFTTKKRGPGLPVVALGKAIADERWADAWLEAKRHIDTRTRTAH